MLNTDERNLVILKAIEQALEQAGYAKMHVPPAVTCTVERLPEWAPTAMDELFLRCCVPGQPISPL